MAGPKGESGRGLHPVRRRRQRFVVDAGRCFRIVNRHLDLTPYFPHGSKKVDRNMVEEQKLIGGTLDSKGGLAQ